MHNFCDGCIDIQATHLNAMKGLEMLHTCNDMIRIFLRFHKLFNFEIWRYELYGNLKNSTKLFWLLALTMNIYMSIPSCIFYFNHDYSVSLIAVHSLCILSCRFPLGRMNTNVCNTNVNSIKHIDGRDAPWPL